MLVKMQNLNKENVVVHLNAYNNALRGVVK